LDVAVEDESDEFGVAVDDGRTTVAADDVVRRNEIERRFKVEFALCRDPTLRQLVRVFALELRRTLVETGYVCERGNALAVLRIAFDRAV